MSAVVSECWVGVDWGHEFHQVCIVDASGNCRDERRFPQSAAGLSDLVQWLRDWAGWPPPAIRIAIERPHGPVVEALLLHDFAVYAVNPKQLDRFRDRHTVAGAKDDRRDALVLADSLRTDPWAFTALQLGEPKLIELRELVRIDEDLRDEENTPAQFFNLTRWLTDNRPRLAPSFRRRHITWSAPFLMRIRVSLALFGSLSLGSVHELRITKAIEEVMLSRETGTPQKSSCRSEVCIATNDICE